MALLIDILIPTLTERREKLRLLLDELTKQIGDLPVNILILEDNREQTTGAKRNQLIEMSEAEYVCFFDDDDWPSENYIHWIVNAAESGMDCASLKGSIELTHGNWKPFFHSRTVEAWYESDGVYYRYPNHLNLIKSEIAKQVKFPDITIGEDHIWSTDLHKRKLIKTEFEIPETIYLYKYAK